MPISIADVVGERRQLKVRFNFGTLELLYKPNEMTPADEDLIFGEGSTEGDVVDMSEDGTIDLTGDDQAERRRQFAMLRVLVRMVERWDVTGPLYRRQPDGTIDTNAVVVEAGLPVPLEIDILKNIPSKFIGDVFRAMYQDMSRDPKKSSKGSGGGSFDQR